MPCTSNVRAAGPSTGEPSFPYIEATYTPALTFATNGDAAFNYTTQTGKYTRVGNFVHVKVSLVFTVTHSTASGNLQCSLPFTSATDSITDYGSVGNFSGLVCGAGVYPQSVQVGSNAAICLFGIRTEATNAQATATTANLTSGATTYTMTFSIEYFAA